MNIPEMRSYEEQAIDTVAYVLNQARSKLGAHQTLTQLAKTRDALVPPAIVSATSLQCPPLAIKSEKLIKETIERIWRLTEYMMYSVKYLECSTDENSIYFYYEAIFSQPTPSYPIPQATVSVFFRVQEKQHDHPLDTERPDPTMTFRMEGRYQDHDVRFVKLTTDSILAVLKKKLKLYKRIEDINLF